ncbi:MAG: hypothetical protein ACRD4O_06790 [Bryobacteraceae bacterium]
MTKRDHLVARLVLLIAAAVALCAYGFGQAQIPPNPPPAKTAAAKPSPAHSAPAAESEPQAAATSLLSEPAQPAKVDLQAGRLTITATNSSLSAILDQIARMGGTKIEGLQTAGNADQRIFGEYGPGAPREVLSELLVGCGYNVVMLGTTPAGTPKELAVSARAPGGVPNPPQQPVQNQQFRSEYGVQPAPFAPPQVQPAPPPQRNGIRTPQEILQELQRMRQQPPH